MSEEGASDEVKAEEVSEQRTDLEDKVRGQAKLGSCKRVKIICYAAFMSI